MTLPKLKLRSIIPPTLKLKQTQVVVNDNALTQQQPPPKQNQEPPSRTKKTKTTTRSLFSKTQLLRL